MRHRRARRTAMRMKARRRCRHRGRVGHEKGRENEARVMDALELLRKEGLISSYWFSTPNDELDCRGVDVVVTTVQGFECQLQIKSSERGVRKHVREHPDIPCINLHGISHPDDIAQFLCAQFDLSR